MNVKQPAREISARAMIQTFQSLDVDTIPTLLLAYPSFPVWYSEVIRPHGFLANPVKNILQNSGKRMPERRCRGSFTTSGPHRPR